MFKNSIKFRVDKSALSSLHPCLRPCPDPDSFRKLLKSVDFNLSHLSVLGRTNCQLRIVTRLGQEEARALYYHNHNIWLIPRLTHSISFALALKLI